MASDLISASAAMPISGAQQTWAPQTPQVTPNTTSPPVQGPAPAGDMVNISAQGLQLSQSLANIAGPASIDNPLSDSRSSSISTAQTSAVATTSADTSMVAMVSTSMPMSVDVYA